MQDDLREQEDIAMHSRDFTNYPVSMPNRTLAPTRAQAARAAVEEKRNLRLALENQAARQRPIVRILRLFLKIFAQSGQRKRAAYSRD